MAYVTKYRVLWTNEKFQDVEILFKKKDGVAGPVQDYAAVNVKFSRNGSEGKFMAISGASLTIEFDMRQTDIDSWADFVTALKDTWMVIATVGGMAYFSGFVLADEGSVPFMDKPYNAKITAVDNIGLLNEINLTKTDGTHFNSHHSIIEYIAACLYQTGLDLPIMVYDNFFHASFLNRNNDLKHDFVSQAYVEYRTFQKDAVTFLDCYSVLERIFKNNFRLFQYNGFWVIIRLGMLQYTPGTGYYTIYDPSGHNPVGYAITENYGTVGKNELIFPCREDQVKYLKKGIKFSKTIYNYTIWPEIPKNNKFEWGHELETGIAYDVDDLDSDGDTTEVYGTYQMISIDDWEFGAVAGGYGTLPFILNPVNEKAYIKKIFNNAYVETDRTIYIEKPLAGAVSWLRSEGIPVVKGDKVSFSCQFKFASGTSNVVEDGVALIFIINQAGTGYVSLYSINGVVKWVYGSLWDSGIRYSYGDNAPSSRFTEYNSVSVESTPIPISGTLYLVLPIGGDANIGKYKAYKDIQFAYLPFVAGGFREVKGDYWKFTQGGQDFVDKSEEEVFLSDNTHKIFKGCLLNSTGIPLTPDWYRMGTSEHKAYNQLTNYNKFQLEQRRYLLIEGTFDGLFSVADNNRTNPQPVGLHTQYRFSDIPAMDQRFILGVPLEANLDTCEFSALFSEVFINDPAFSDGVMSGTDEYKYIF